MPEDLRPNANLITKLGAKLGLKSVFLFVPLIVLLFGGGALLAFSVFSSDTATFNSGINTDNPLRQHLLKVDGDGELIATLTDKTEIDENKVRYTIALLNDSGDTVSKISGNTVGQRIKLSENVTAGVYTFAISTEDQLTEAGTRYRLKVQYPNETADFSDSSAPTVSVSAPELGSRVSNIFTISGEADDNVELAQVSIRIDKGSWVLADGTTSWNIAIDSTKFENGNRIIDIEATDESGNKTTESTLFDFQNESPTSEADPNPTPNPKSDNSDSDQSANPNPQPDPGQGPVSENDFSVDFAGNGGLDKFKVGVFHRGAGSQVLGESIVQRGDGNSRAGHGGSWTADHDLNCGAPSTQRSMTSSSNNFNIDKLVYTCKDHVMTTMGNVDGYSIVWFSPDQTFTRNTQKTVSWDVNVTDLGGRQWWEVSIVPTGAPFLATVDWLAGTANIANYNAKSVVVGSGPFGGDVSITTNGENQYNGWQGICGDYGLDNAGCASKMIRRPFSINDNSNGTLTIDYGGMFSQTVQGTLPNEYRVYFKDHNYTPDKDNNPSGYTWHWDNIFVGN